MPLKGSFKIKVFFLCAFAGQVYCSSAAQRIGISPPQLHHTQVTNRENVGSQPQDKVNILFVAEGKRGGG